MGAARNPWLCGCHERSYTQDAVAWVDKHNYEGKRPLIDLWSEARLKSLLSERPYLAAEFGLR